MGTPRRQRSRQGELFARSTRAAIALDENHRLVVMTHEIDWTLIELIQAIRLSKLKSDAGRPPHLRALGGALIFRATRRMTYREAEAGAPDPLLAEDGLRRGPAPMSDLRYPAIQSVRLSNCNAGPAPPISHPPAGRYAPNPALFPYVSTL